MEVQCHVYAQSKHQRFDSCVFLWWIPVTDLRYRHWPRSRLKRRTKPYVSTCASRWHAARQAAYMSMPHDKANAGIGEWRPGIDKHTMLIGPAHLYQGPVLIQWLFSYTVWLPDHVPIS